ncbi:30S ribosomal protein S9 [Caldibacillus thermoamylovorans]|nr:30S ribosomal protein S9 [Caldibacillus thermoamylovorans]PAC33993.1 30S ribosomal protein S9 [Caldifermentibacillus hisashii]
MEADIKISLSSTKERKKYGLKGARRAPQFSKR